MAFDQATRNRLARFVGDARALLTEECTRQLQREYGIDPASGDVVDLDGTLAHLDDTRRETARLLRDTLDHYLAGGAGSGAKARQDALDRIVREQAFTVINRLCAMRMAEARGLLVESVARGYQSKGFQLYARLAGTALGETGDAYRCYLWSVFDEFAVDLPVLFDRFSPQGRLFPGEAALLRLLDLLNHPEIEPLWAEDETLGWIYQYFNSKEERKAMRDASQAPRNSRELAVRNQFFTPRYVVEFLADNTLGRIWYEMTAGQTGLVDSCRYLVRRPNEVFLGKDDVAPAATQTEIQGGTELSQEVLLRQTVYISYRQLKDPRSITMLDPACGSMHFGLYAFDLFERIYDEAWKIEAERGPQALERFAGVQPLHASYADKAAFLRDVPRLIIERNIHGVDIDPRAVQIAGLSLWLRAQRSWRTQGLRAQDRPQIRRSNVVCAEPMPGDRGLLEEFITRQLAATAEDRVVADLVREIFKAMTLAGEAGSLLKIEEEIGGAVEAAKERYDQALLQQRKEANYLPGLAPERDTTLLDLLDLPRPEEFWAEAEERIYNALHAYAAHAEDGAGFRRRLFADDAERGFAFIDLCRKRYDVVLMNPPFGSPSLRAEKYLHQAYSESQFEIYGQFLLRMAQTLSNHYVGAITSRGFLFLANFKSIRNAIYPSLSKFIDLGRGVLDDAFVEVCAFVLDLSRTENVVHCIDARNSKEKLISIFDYQDLINIMSITDFDLSLLSFLPTKPFCYDTPSTVIRMFGSQWTIEPETNGIARVGLATGDNERFVRCYWEVPSETIGVRWQWHAKGGEYLPFKPDVHLIVDWLRNGQVIEASFEGARIKKNDVYFRSGITYSRRSLKGLSFRILPSGCISGEKGPVIIAPGHEYAVLALTNSTAYKYLVQIQCSASSFEIGAIQRTPVPKNFKTIESDLVNLGLELVNLYIFLSSLDETDTYFQVPLSLTTSKSFAEAAFTLGNLLQVKRDRAHNLLAKLDNLVFSSYGWPLNHHIDHEYDKMLEGFTIENILKWSCITAISICFSIAAGHLTSKSLKTTVDLDNLFGPLPKGAYLTAIANLDSNNSETKNGILVDDEGHREDIEGRVREALRVVWGERADAIEQEACGILDVRTLREYLRRPASFFADHLQRYSKSRRQAPIYWPLATPSGNYTLWLYYHRLTDQTLYTCVNDLVDPKLRQVAEDAARLRQKTGRSRPEERDLECLGDLEGELRDFRAELLRVAAFWRPNLNDGVQITAAPLWRMFQHKPWQKKLKETWESLERGDYDWAHIAYSIWPARVRAKCVTDKSLAIAHDLEDVYVEPVASAGKKGRRKKAVKEEEGMFGEEQL